MKAFRITSKDQYVQDMNLNRGTYTYSAWVLAMGSNYSIGLKTQAGTWLNFNMRDQIKALEWRKVKITFTINEPCVQFSLMNTFASEAAYVIVAAPMLEEGTNAGTHKPSDLDMDESIGESSYTVLLSNENHTFAGTETTALAGSTETQVLVYKGTERVFPTSITVNTADLPTGMSRTISLETSRVTFNVTTAMTSPSGTIPITFVVNGRSMTALFSYSISFKGGKGEDAAIIRLTTPFQLISIDSSGTMIPSSPFVVVGTPTNTTITMWRYSTDGSFSSTTTPPTGVTRSGNTVTINPLTVTFKTLNISASNGSISDSITIVKVADGAKGEDAVPPIIVNGFWAFWDYALQDYVTSEFSATGDDGHSPYILNDYWWEWDSELGEYVNTGIKAVGKDGKDGEDGITPVVTQLVPSVILIGKSIGGGDPQPNTFTVKHLDGSGNAVNAWLAAFGSDDGDVWYPIEYAEYASFIVVNVAAYPYKYFVVRSYSPSFFPAPEEVYWSTPYLLSVSVGMYDNGKDGLPGIPGQVPVQKEWVAGDRHRNSDEIVDYIYVRGLDSETSYWYQLIGKTDTQGIIAGAIPTGGSTPEGYKAVSWMKSLAVKTLIAEEANLANFIFKEGKLISIKGATFAGEEINYGEYTEYNFASTTTQPAVGSASWLEIPPSTIRWIRYKKNTGSSWTVKRAGTGTGQWTMQFATAPEGETWYSSYSANRFWARVKVGGESDYGKPFRFTPAGGYDFIPNVMLDGLIGEISGDKVIANNIRNKLWLAYSNNPTEIAAILGNGQSVNLSATSMQPVDYSWYTITLPNDKKLSGSTLTIHFPTASQKRYKIKTEKTNGIFYLNEPIKVLSELQVVNGVRGSIELKGVWDEINQTLDWHVISQVRYMLNQAQPTISRPSPYLLPNELVYRGRCSVDDSNPATLTKHYQSITTQITAAKNTYGTTKVIITVPMPAYFSPTGSVLRRTAYNSGTLLRLEAMPIVGGRTMYVYPSFTTNSHWYFEVSVYDSTVASIYGGFDFNIYTNDYLIQSEWMDNKFDNN